MADSNKQVINTLELAIITDKKGEPWQTHRLHVTTAPWVLLQYKHVCPRQWVSNVSTHHVNNNSHDSSDSFHGKNLFFFSFFLFCSLAHLPPSTYPPNYVSVADSPLSAGEETLWEWSGTVNDSGRVRETREGKGGQHVYCVKLKKRNGFDILSACLRFLERFRCRVAPFVTAALPMCDFKASPAWSFAEKSPRHWCKRSVTLARTQISSNYSI